MDVLQQVEMSCIAKQADTEQPVFIQIEWLDKTGLFSLDVVYALYGQFERLTVVDGLLRIALLVQFDTGEQRRMGGYCCLDG